MVIDKLVEFKNYKRVFAFYVLKKSLRNIIYRGYGNRTREIVNTQYDKAWSGGYSKSTKLNSKPILHYFNERVILCMPIERRKHILREISDVLTFIKPGNVLEMGSGNGFNVLALAILNPEIKIWEGIELTEGGVEAAKRFLANPPLDALMYVTSKPKEEILATLQNAKIKFMQGDITGLSHYSNDSFDCVFTYQSIEQIPVEYYKAFSEAYRITRKHAIFFEGFKEAQRNIFQRIHQINADYFRYSFQVTKKTGFRILKFEPSAFDKLHLSNGLLLCEKR